MAWGFDPWAAVRKAFGDQSADVVTGVNFRKEVTPYLKNPNKDHDDMMNKIGDQMIKEGKAKLARKAKLAAAANTGYAGAGYAPAYDPYAAAAAEAAAKKAAEDRKRTKLRSESGETLDELMDLYDEVIQKIQSVGKDSTNRLNKQYDQKVQGQVEDMNTGMYDTDVAAAAGNLGDSSFRSFDRGKVRKAADANIETLNDARQNDLSTVGSMVSENVAKYKADRGGIDRTRRLLKEEDDVDALQKTANNLDATRRGVQADQAKYGSRGSFVKKANSLGDYDTSALEATLDAIVANASATPSNKAGAISDILNGTAVDDKTKERLKNKYTQNIG